jgi:hypothetical protein
MGQLGIDIAELQRNLSEVGKRVKSEVHGMFSSTRPRTRTNPLAQEHEPASVSVAAPKPEQWLSYSRQHSFRNGLISLFGGAGLGAVLYLLGNQVIQPETIQDLELLARVRGLDQIIRMIWIVAAVPMLKGLGQLVYGAFFAESMMTLAERFVPRLPPPQARLPVVESSAAEEFPPSVTEQTTFNLNRAKAGQNEM